MKMDWLGICFPYGPGRVPKSYKPSRAGRDAGNDENEQVFDGISVGSREGAQILEIWAGRPGCRK